MNDYQGMELAIELVEKFWKNATDDESRAQWDAILTFMKAARNLLAPKP